jgi:hypothetical protein
LLRLLVAALRMPGSDWSATNFLTGGNRMPNPPIGSGPNSTGLIILGDQLQPIIEYNRADFKVVSEITGTTTNTPTPIRDAISKILEVLPVGPTISTIQQTQQNDFGAISVTVHLIMRLE